MTGALSNAEQLEYWNGLAGERWVQNQAAIDQAFAAFAVAGIDALGATVGERILDVGCGAGGTALELASRVGDTGSVVGIDISRPLLALARQRAVSRQNLSFIEADASTHAFRVAHDAVFSRFGVMFFADPVLAFDNLRRALTPRGRLAFVCWQRLSDNPWSRIPLEAAAHVLGEPPRFAEPTGPGPFALAEPELVQRTLAAAGFQAIEVRAFHAPVELGSSTHEAVDFVLRVGPAARLAAEQSVAVREQIRERIAAALRPLEQAGRVALGAAAWLVTARVS